MSVQPVLRSPLTDLTGSILNHQYFGQCGQREMDMVECMEAYGVHQGRVKCKDLIEDFHECFSYDKQIFRYYVSLLSIFQFSNIVLCLFLLFFVLFRQ